MERRKFPRQDVRGTPLKATLVLTGGSLINKDMFSSVEIETHPINLSRGGVSLCLGLNAAWATMSPKKEVDVFLHHGKERKAPIHAKVVRVEQEEQVLSLEFTDPLEDMNRYLLH